MLQSRSFWQHIGAIDDAVNAWRREIVEPPCGFMSHAETRESAVELERAGTGKKWFDEVRAKIDEVNDWGDKLVVTQMQQQADNLSNITNAILLCAFLMVGSSIGLVMLLTRAISTPVTGLTDAMGALASGDLATEVPGTDRGDEIGSMAQAVQVFKDNMIAADAMRAEQVRAEEEKEQRQLVVTEAIRSFETVIGRIVETVSSTSGQLETAAGTLTKTADTTQQLSTMVAAASEQTSANVQGVAAASEQLSSTVSEIGRQVQESSSIAGQAVSQATQNQRERDRAVAVGRPHRRRHRSHQHDRRTDEPARPQRHHRGGARRRCRQGLRGRGSGGQGARRSDRQGHQRDRDADRQACSPPRRMPLIAIQEIAGTINKMSEISGAIAAAVEEQGATTQEISRNVMEAAKGTSEVASSITDVSRGASETGSESANVLSSAKHLSSESMRLRSEVERFLTTVRAA